MRLNVSEINLFQECEWLWWARYVKMRVPRAFDVAPAAGTFWHQLMARYVQDWDKAATLEEVLPQMQRTRNSIVELGGTDQDVYDFQDLCDRLISLFGLYKDLTEHQETLFIERPLEAPLPVRYTYDHRLMGTPDRVIKMKDGSVWNVQYKTLSDRTPPAVYVAAAERSLHELAYAFLITQDLKIPFSSYGGTVLNVVRKISRKQIETYPEKAFIQELVPIREEEVQRAINDMAQLGDRMEQLVLGLRPPISNRLADTNRFGNVLSRYYDARRELVELEDDTLFRTASPRYGDGDSDLRSPALSSGL